MTETSKQEVLNVTRIHLGPNEWDNTLMQQVATEEIERNGHLGPLLVYVYEHAGWVLAFTKIEGKVVVVGSANDLAVYSPKVEEFRRHWYDKPTNQLQEVWRP